MEASTFTAGLECGRIAEFLFCLGDKYPGGLDWLDRRLDDIGAGRAQLFRVMAGADLAALAIETPKGRHYKKLSTFIVSPLYRRVGVGGRLITALQSSWLRNGIDQVHVTIDSRDSATQSFFETYDFHQLPSGLVDYGQDRLDAVFIWRPPCAFTVATARH
jgi:GNAT superfamily N-acetyltransferase